MKASGKESLKDRIIRLLLYSSGTGRIFGTARHGSIHLYGKRKAWYVFPYRKMEISRHENDKDSRRIRAFWDFIDGKEKHYKTFYDLYLRAIRQVLHITKVKGDFEITAIPRSDPEKENVLSKVASEIARLERFPHGRAIDGSGLLKRNKKLIPVHRGGKYSVDEIRESMEITRPLRSGRIILLDDLIFSGKTGRACRMLLKKAGAREVYLICMYGHARPENRWKSRDGGEKQDDQS